MDSRQPQTMADARPGWGHTNLGDPSWIKLTSEFFFFYSGMDSVMYKYYKHLQMHVAVACIITMYGNTKATPAMHSRHGNFFLY